MIRRREFIAGLGAPSTWSVGLHARRAQQPAMPLIGFFDFLGLTSKSPLVEAFRPGLADGGFVEDANRSIEYRSAGGESRRLPALVADLLIRQVAVIVAVGGVTPALSAKAAISTVPIVFLYGGDPVTNGLVAGRSRPGGNVTGINAFTGELAGKRLDLLTVVPQATGVDFSRAPDFVLPTKTKQLQCSLREVRAALQS